MKIMIIMSVITLLIITVIIFKIIRSRFCTANTLHVEHRFLTLCGFLRLILALNSLREEDPLTVNEILFHSLRPTKASVSFPYLTFQILQDLNLV